MNSSAPQFYRKVIFIFLIVVIVFGGIVWFLNRGFRLTGTDPGLDNVATASPYIKVNFNKKLSTKNVGLDSNPDIISRYQVDGKTLVIYMKGVMSASQEYTITIKSVSDTIGRTIKNQQLIFTPKNLSYTQLSKDQQKALVEQQTKKPGSKDNIYFNDMDSLLEYGVTNAQLNGLEEALYNFRSSAAQISIDKVSISAVPHDPNSSSMTDTVYFNVIVDNETFKARLDYSYLNSIHLYLYDHTGGQVFDSGNVTT